MMRLIIVAIGLALALTPTTFASARPLPPPVVVVKPVPAPVTPVKGEGSVLEIIKAGSKVTPDQAAADPTGLLQGFLASWVLPDVTAAKADADSQNPPDTIGSMCWGAVINFINSNPNLNPLPSGLGAAQLIQKARDIAAIAAQINSPTGPLAPLKIGCGPLVLDQGVQGANLLVQIGSLIGVVGGL